MINREDAKALLYTHLKTQSLRNHCIAVAYVMEALAPRLNLNAEECFLAGLLHDIDLDYIGTDFSQHGVKAMELLKDAGLTDEMKKAIRAHTGNEHVETIFDQALWIADPITGLITASAYMRPDRKVSTIELPSLKKKFKSKGFAAGVSREQIQECEKLDIPLDEYLSLALKAMAEHEEELGF
jgi:putative nucleotidyltransferase with HDIG domain